MKTFLLFSINSALFIFYFVSQLKISFGNPNKLNIIGVHPKNLDLFVHGKPFTCIDGSKVISFDRINDEFCDCADGSDEPGTSACSFGKFYCRNRGHEAITIFSSRVNDGICDCCDGSDENNGLKKCENTCKEAGASAMAELKKKVEDYREGEKIHSELVQKAKEKKLKWRADLIALKEKQLNMSFAFQEISGKKKKIDEKEKIKKEWQKEIEIDREYRQQIHDGLCEKWAIKKKIIEENMESNESMSESDSNKEKEMNEQNDMDEPGDYNEQNALNEEDNEKEEEEEPDLEEDIEHREKEEDIEEKEMEIGGEEEEEISKEELGRRIAERWTGGKSSHDERKEIEKEKEDEDDNDDDDVNHVENDSDGDGDGVNDDYKGEFESENDKEENEKDNDSTDENNEQNEFKNNESYSYDEDDNDDGDDDDDGGDSNDGENDYQNDNEEDQGNEEISDNDGNNDNDDNDEKMYNERFKNRKFEENYEQDRFGDGIDNIQTEKDENINGKNDKNDNDDDSDDDCEENQIGFTPIRLLFSCILPLRCFQCSNIFSLAEKSPLFITDKKIIDMKNKYEKIKKEVDDIQKQISSIEKKLNKNYGPNDEFLSLVNKKISIKINQYDYEIKLFDSATQIEDGSHTNLGNWKGFSPNYTRLFFKNGAHCWNGPQRSLKMDLVCGKGNRIVSIDEPSRCEYHGILTTPAVCNANLLHSLEKELEEREREIED